MNIVICGGGIIGVSTAYFLAKRNISCVIIEQEAIACGASGKAGGFLAKTWCKSNECDELAIFSYELHMQLAKEFNDVDYRNVNTYSAFIDKNHSPISKNISEQLKWIDGPALKCTLLESSDTTSQVHPKKLCQKLLEETQRMTNNGTQIIYDTIIGIEFDDSCSLPIVKAVKLQSGSNIDADHVLIAMGPWSKNALEWFPKRSFPIIRGHRAHSIVLKAPKNVSIPADCVFLQYKNDRGISSPEIYPRPDGTVYLCGFGDDPELPKTASAVNIERWKCSQLREVAYSACSSLEASDVLAEQACFLPLSSDGIPVIGKICTVQGAYIATGHSCWGILNSTGTGFAMAELITDGKCKSINLTPFSPGRIK